MSLKTTIDRLSGSEAYQARVSSLGDIPEPKFQTGDLVCSAYQEWDEWEDNQQASLYSYWYRGVVIGMFYDPLGQLGFDGITVEKGWKYLVWCIEGHDGNYHLEKPRAEEFLEHQLGLSKRLSLVAQNA